MTRARWKLIATAAVFMALPFAWFLLPKEWINGLLEKVRLLGPWGPVAAAFLYVPACVLMIPGSMLTLGIGFLFGLVRGIMAVSAGSVAGATAAFLIARYAARDRVKRKMDNQPVFQALDSALHDGGLKLVILIRLSPAFPFVVLNYIFGVTQVTLRDYVLGSWIGMFPGTVMYVYLGSIAASLTDLSSEGVTRTPAQWALTGVGLVATVVVTVWLTRAAKKSLEKNQPAVAKSGKDQAI